MHGKLICKECKEVLVQCRCPDHGNNIDESFEPCAKCESRRETFQRLNDICEEWRDDFLKSEAKLQIATEALEQMDHEKDCDSRTGDYACSCPKKAIDKIEAME